jgi:hypothetical protein
VLIQNAFPITNFTFNRSISSWILAITFRLIQSSFVPYVYFMDNSPFFNKIKISCMKAAGIFCPSPITIISAMKRDCFIVFSISCGAIYLPPEFWTFLSYDPFLRIRPYQSSISQYGNNRQRWLHWLIFIFIIPHHYIRTFTKNFSVFGNFNVYIINNFSNSSNSEPPFRISLTDITGEVSNHILPLLEFQRQRANLGCNAALPETIKSSYRLILLSIC